MMEDTKLALILYNLNSLTYARLCHFRILPESARWLVVQDRLDEAHRVLRKFAKRSSTPVPTDFLKNALASCRQGLADDDVHVQTTKLSRSPLDLLRTSRMRVRSLILWFNW